MAVHEANGQYHEAMLSSPRLNRGTSIIAALVFAAVLGAIALGLNAFDSNSVNTSALPAAAATPAVDTQCQAGWVYYISTKNSSGATDVDSSDISAVLQPNGHAQVSLSFETQDLAPNGAVVLGKAQAIGCNYDPKTSAAGSSGGCSTIHSTAGLGEIDAQCNTSADIWYGSGSSSLYNQKAVASCVGDGSSGSGVEIYSDGGAIKVEQCTAGQSLKGVPSATSATTATGGFASPQSCGTPGSNPATCIPTGDNANAGAITCGQPGANPSTCIPATNSPNGSLNGVTLPQNCSASGAAVTCTGSNQAQADSLQDNLGDGANSNYVCNYDSSSQTTSCSIDNTGNAPGTPGAVCGSGTVGSSCTGATGAAGTCQGTVGSLICTPSGGGGGPCRQSPRTERPPEP